MRREICGECGAPITDDGACDCTELLKRGELREQRQSDDTALLRQALEELKTEIEALRAEVERLRTDGASAIRWAPLSAYWSEVLRGLFGPDARKGIDALETRWREERERDEALLRQALQALLGQRGEPDWRTGKQREDAIAALRERLGEKA